MRHEFRVWKIKFGAMSVYLDELGVSAVSSLELVKEGRKCFI